MSWELRNTICDLEIIKEKFDDINMTYGWFDDEYFTHEPNHVLNKDEIMMHGMKYHEHRVHNTQTLDLMTMYLNQFDKIVKKFHEIEKASCENFGERSQNAQQ